MSPHGTAPYTEGQLAEFLGAGTRALVLIASKLGVERMGYWADRKGEELESVFLKALANAGTEQVTPPSRPTYPAVDEVFKLTLDGDSPENQPLEMVRRDGSSPEGWQHTGKKVAGKQTQSFKLVSVGYCRSFAELTRKLAEHGAVPEGQWREALKARYQADGKGPVGIADSSWVYPNGDADFPCVLTDGYSLFYWTVRDFFDDWRWLVGVSK